MEKINPNDRLILTLTEEQIRLVAECVQDIHDFACGDLYLRNMFRRIRVAYGNSFKVLSDCQRFVTPDLSRLDSYNDFHEGKCKNEKQKKFIRETYNIYGEILYTLAQHDVYVHPEKYIDASCDDIPFYCGISYPEGCKRISVSTSFAQDTNGDSELFCISLTLQQLMIISDCVKDLHCFAQGCTSLLFTTMDMGMPYSDKMLLSLNMRKCRKQITPNLRNDEFYDWNGGGCNNEHQVRFITDTYCISREIDHQLSLMYHRSSYLGDTPVPYEGYVLPSIKKAKGQY